MTTIAFIGLGNMGNPMAANLVKAGHRVQGFDLMPENVSIARDNGVIAEADAPGAVDGAEVVITMLPAGKHVLDVYEEIAPTAAKGTLLIDCSTVDVESARKAHAIAAKHGMPSIDAPPAFVFVSVDWFRSAPVRFAPVRSALVSVEPPRSAPVRLAPLKSASVSVEANRSAPARFCPVKSQPVRSLPASLMPCRFCSW